MQHSRTVAFVINNKLTEYKVFVKDIVKLVLRSAIKN